MVDRSNKPDFAGSVNHRLLAINHQRPTLFLDLDGPLLDVRQRYYGVYAEIAVELGALPLSLDEYWTAKRRQRPLPEFFPGVDEAHLRLEYLERWLARIESPQWLRHDRLVRGVAPCLESLSRSWVLYLVTLRRDPVALSGQLEWHGLAGRFTGIFSGWPDAAEGSMGAGSGYGVGAQLKASWMAPLLCGQPATMVGDSEVDMGAAALLGIPAIGVSFGIREPEALIALGAARIVDDLAELPACLSAMWEMKGQLR